MLDPGHTIKKPGALGAAGVYEKAYNDELTEMIKELLEKEGDIRVSLSRSPNEEVTLEERVRRANSKAVDLFLSIHHDSLPRAYLEEISVEGRRAFVSTVDASGYSLLVSGRSSYYHNALLFAAELGKSFETIGRKPYTEEIDPRRSGMLIDKRLGIYRFDNLAVLRGVNMPAVLLEAGFIVDREDEQYLRTNTDLIAAQVVKGVLAYRQITKTQSNRFGKGK